MKPIYFFIQHYPKWRTGGLKYHSIVYEYALSKGYDVRVFGNSKIEDKSYKIKFIRLFYGLWNTMKIPRKSLILMSNASFFDYYLPIVLNKFYKKHKYFFIIHHLVQTEKPKSKARRYLESRFIKLADGCCAISKTTSDQLFDLGLVKEDLKLVPPGLDVNSDEIKYKKVFPKIPRLLFVGTVERRKGLFDLIKALEYLDKYKYELFVVGSIKEEEYYQNILLELKKNNNDKVKFLGTVEHDELTQNYLDASFFVFPSYWEGYGMVIAEAMAYGLPIVASNIPSTRELVEDQKEGLLFELSNPEQIAQCIKYLLDNPLKLNEMSENAKRKANNFPTWEETSEKVMKIIDDFSRKIEH